MFSMNVYYANKFEIFWSMRLYICVAEGRNFGSLIYKAHINKT